MKKEIKRNWEEFSNGTKLMFKEFFNKDTNKKQRANMWTFSRLIISFFIPICSILSIISSLPLFLIFSLLITCFGALTDFFDGRSARKYNSTSEYGALLDQIADKVFSIMIGINVSLFNPLFIITILGEGLIAGTNILYKLKNNKLKIKSTQIGRIKQWPLSISLILGFLSLLSPGIHIYLNISVIITFILQLITTTSYIKCNNESINKLKIEANNFESQSIEQIETINEKSIDAKLNEKYKNKEQYILFKELLQQIINNESQKDVVKNINNDYQKIKK